METVYWKDIDIGLRKKYNNDVLDMINEDAIVNSLTNIFETLIGTRRMLPEFAVSIWNLLFEPIDRFIASRLGELLLYAFAIWEPRIEVDNIHVKVDEDNNQYCIDVTYHILSSANLQYKFFSYILQAR